MTGRRTVWIAILALLGPGCALAADIPVGVAKLLLKDVGITSARRAKVAVKGAATLDVAALPTRPSLARRSR